MRDTPHRVLNFTFCAADEKEEIRIQIKKAFEVAREYCIDRTQAVPLGVRQVKHLSCDDDCGFNFFTPCL